MSLPEITYQLHDSSIVAVASGPRQEVAFVIDLYPIFYPTKPRIVLRFGGILNFESVQRFVANVEADADDSKYIGCRIESFQYDTKRDSKSDDYWFFLEVAGSNSMRIHCSKMTMLEVDSENRLSVSDL